MKLLKVFVFLLMVTKGFGQSNLDPLIDTTKLYSKIMIVPFEEHMYLCGIQSKLAVESKMNHAQIIKYFRYGIASELQSKFLYLYNTSSLIHMQDTVHDLDRTYAAVRYKFEVYEEEQLEGEKEKEVGLKALKFKTKKKKETSTVASTKIQNGQLVSQKNAQKKFASFTVKTPKTFTYLAEKYRTDLFVFVTEMDIENDISDQVALANNKYFRHLRLHYVMVDKDGNFISKGVVQTTFPNTVNKVSEIKSVYFPILAQKLALKLPAIPKPEPEVVDPLEKIRVE